jgi:hypothetical protein
LGKAIRSAEEIIKAFHPPVLTDLPTAFRPEERSVILWSLVSALVPSSITMLHDELLLDIPCFTSNPPPAVGCISLSTPEVWGELYNASFQPNEGVAMVIRDGITSLLRGPSHKLFRFANR